MTMTETTQAVWPAGFAMNPRVPGPAPEILNQVRGVPTAMVSDSIGRIRGSIGLRAYSGDEIMCGVAVTVRVRPGDNLMFHKALEIAQAGDVLVVDAGGELSQAIVGGNIRATMIQKKVAGIVLDGALRDLTEWAEGGMPAFAKGSNHRGPSKDGPGEVNVPISCAGMVVKPGDVIIGDPDGVVAIGGDELEGWLPAIRATLAREDSVRAMNIAGTADPERFNKILRALGCPV
jgi:regulator of RNase E activity RraA